MRAFIAIELSRDLQDKLAALEDKLKTGSPDVKWVEPENIHLTLKFLGDVTQEKIAALKKSLSDLTGGFDAFSAEITGLGGFPNLKSPRIIWIGIKNNAMLLTMVKFLEENLEKLGFPKEKRAFSAHLTLGRLRHKALAGKARPAKNLGILRKSLEDNLDFSAGILEIKGLSLIESKLTPGGPSYTTLYSAPLNYPGDNPQG